MLTITKRTDHRLLKLMAVHYSRPKGFVGRNICYAIEVGGRYYGHIVAGSATRFLPGRAEFFSGDIPPLNSLVNNIFFHVEKVEGRYPYRNFTTDVVRQWRQLVVADWPAKYGDPVLGLESLVELPRTGELYIRDGWKITGTTKGYTCKRIAGSGTDSWSGCRVWDTKNLRPKHVLMRLP